MRINRVISRLATPLFLILWTNLAAAQTSLYLRYGAGPRITVTAASNSTPIQISTTQPHGFNAGDVVWIWGIEGNTNADGTRVVAAVQDNTHFTIRYMNGSNAVGNGAFSAASRMGAWCGSTVRYTLAGHPRLWFDGPGGSMTARLKDPDGTGSQKAPRAQSGNPPWDALTSWLDSVIGSNYQWNGSNFGQFRNGTFAPIANMALRWFSDNSQTTYRNGAIHWIQNAERIVETLACDESVGACGDATDADYGAGYYITPLAQTYTLMHDQLSQPDITRFAGMMLNDKTDGATCTSMYTTGMGTVTAATSAGVMTGAGTNWLSTLSPGDSIFPAGYNPWVVVSVDSDTQLHFRTANLPGIAFSGQTLAYQIAHPWAPGNCGWSFWAKHSGYSVLSAYPGYPTQGGVLTDDLFGNQFLTKTAAFLNIGLATADDDPRGARMAEGAANWFQDVGFPLYLKYWTGPTQIDSQYGPDRFGIFMVDVVSGLYNSTGGAVNYLAGNWLKNRALFNIYEWLPTSDAAAARPYGIGYGISNFTSRAWNRTLDPAQLSGIYSSAQQGQYLNFFMRSVRGDFTSSGIQIGSCYACPTLYTFTDPSYTSTDYRNSLPTSMAFIHTDVESTSPNTNTSMIIDRTGFSSPNDTLLHIMAVDEERDTNHLSSSSTGTYNPGSYSIYKHHQLLGEDSGSGVQTTSGYTAWDNSSMFMEVGGQMNLKDADGVSVIGDVQVSRYGDGGSGSNGNKYMYALVDSSGAYAPAAAIGRLHRHFLDFKGGSAQFILVYDDVETRSGAMKRTFLHYPNNGQSGEGLTTFDPSTSTVVSLDGPGGTALRTQVLFPGTPGFTYVDNNNGSYTGGAGQTFRVSVCAGSGNNAASCDSTNLAAEFLTVHMPAANQSSTLPAMNLITALDPAFRGLEIAGASPKLALFARQGVLNNGVSTFTTQLPGSIQILVAGLTAGAYTISKNGAVFLQNQPVADRDNSLYFEGTAGTYVILPQAPRPPLRIRALTPPLAYAGVHYSFTWSATGGYPPYTWTLASGSLPQGLTLDTDGSLSGIATAAGSAQFTVQVSDGAGGVNTFDTGLTVSQPVNAIDVRVADVNSSNGIVRYGRAGLDANVSCTVSVALDSAQQTPVLQFSDAGGTAWRRAALDNGAGLLAAGKVYYVQVVCGGEYGNAVVTTTPAVDTQPSSVRISMRGPEMAQTAELEYGNTPALGSLMRVACASGCEAIVNAPSGSVLFIRRKYYDASLRPLATSSVSTVLVP